VYELTDLLDHLIGEDEWSRQAHLERLRTEGITSVELTALAALLAGDDPARRAGARMALAALASPACPAAEDAGRRLIEALGSSDPDLRVMAASAMGESGNQALVPPLVSALRDAHPNVAAAAADALGELEHPSALRPLIERLEASDFWVRMAAVVAIGRLRDVAALPALDRVAGVAGLEPGVVEAVRRIADPAGLEVLEHLRERVPAEALDAAGEILSAHPETPPPAWIVEAAGDREASLRAELMESDRPGLGRLLGLAGTPSAVAALLDLAGPPRRSEAAIAGLLAVPPDARAEGILRRIGAGEPQDQVMLLSLLPPLDSPDHIPPLLPLLTHPVAQVRAAAAEALSRSAAPGSLHIIEEELGRPTVSPEVVRAAGALGRVACGALLPLLEDADPEVRGAAADALARCADPSIEAGLASALRHEDHPAALRSILRALAAVGGDAAVPVLTDAMRDDDPETRMVAIESLGSTRSAAAIVPLELALQGSRAEVLAAIRAIGDVGGPAALALLRPFLHSRELDERRTAVAAAGRADAAGLDLHTLAALASDPDSWIRRRAAPLLATRGDDGLDTLHRMAAEDPDPDVRREARRAADGAR
jgi:HEAT repeat protein